GARGSPCNGVHGGEYIRQDSFIVAGGNAAGQGDSTARNGRKFHGLFTAAPLAGRGARRIIRAGYPEIPYRLWRTVMNRRMAGLLILLTSGALAAGGSPGDTKAIGPEEAARKVNETVTVRMEVKSVGK